MQAEYRGKHFIKKMRFLIAFVYFTYLTMLCSFCGKAVGTINDFVKHVAATHRSEPYFRLMCGINGCPRTFTRYSSFSSHIYRNHNEALTKKNCLQHQQSIPKRPKYECNICQETISYSGTEIISHLKTHIKSGSKVKCPYDECCKEYAVLSSFTAHMSRNHCQNLEQSEPQDQAQSSYSEIRIDQENTSSADATQTDEVSVYNNICDNEVFLRSLLQCFLKLQECERLPISTVDKVVEEMNITVSLSYQHTESSVLSILEKAGIDSSIQNLVSDEFKNNIFKKSISVIDTAHKRKTCTENLFPVIKPVTVSLGINSKHKHRSYQYVSILDSLKCMLKSDNVLSAVVEGGHSSHEEHSLCDFSDGSYYKSNELFTINQPSIQLVLYYDEFEVVNPLGSKRGKQKLAAVYASIGNVNAFQRSELKSIQLCLLCPVVDVKDFGINSIFQPLVFDLKILEQDGIFIESLNQNIKGTVSYIAGDNLGSHQIGGFLESFGPNVGKLCRFCMASSVEIQEHFDPNQFVERDSATHNFHVNKVIKDPSLTREYGVKQGSVFNELKYFHVSRGLPPDCMHDIFEGCAKREIPIVLKELTKTYCTEEDILSNIKAFQYGRGDIENKPAEPNSFGSLTTQSAIQMWTLLRLLPLMIGHLIPEGEKVWEILLLLKEITEVVMSPAITESVCAYLQAIITEHHLLFKEMFPDTRLTAKHHYLIHYPQMIMKFGPLRSCWCMRFEAKHSYFKQMAIRMKNYKKLSSTLANRHQKLQSYVQSSDEGYSRPNVEVPNCKLVSCLADYLTLKAILLEKGDDIEDYVSVKKLTVNGIIYNVGSYLITDFENDEPKITRVTHILMRNNDIVIVGKDHAAQLNSHYRAYQLMGMQETSVYSLTNLIDPVPLDGYRVQGRLYCVLKHHILNKSY